MEIKIQLAKKEHLRDCIASIKNSDLWDAYFKTNPTTETVIMEMILKKQIYVALNMNHNCIGFMGVVHNGCFRKFSYLSLIAVKKRYRSKGIGKILIGKFENIGFKKADRIFILVRHENPGPQGQVRVQWLCHLNGPVLHLT